MKNLRTLCLGSILSIAIVGCVGENEVKNDNPQSLHANNAVNSNIKAVDIPSKTLNDLESEAIKDGTLKVQHISNQAFEVNLPSEVIMTYTLGSGGASVWFKQYHAGVLSVDQHAKLCSLHFNSIYNKQYDVIFGDSNCNNKDGDECQIPYYVAAHGDIRKVSYNPYIHYQYSVALDGKDCNNGISPVLFGSEQMKISKQDDNNFHSVFAVDTDKNVMPPENNKDGLPSLLLDRKGGESVFVYGTGAQSTTSVLLDEKMTHDYAHRTFDSFGSLKCEPEKFHKSDFSYSLSPELDKRCAAEYGEGAKDIGIMFTNQFLGTQMTVDTLITEGFRNSVHLLYSEYNQINLLPGQSQRVDLCLSKEAFSGLIKHNYNGVNAGKQAVGDGFFNKTEFAKFLVTHDINNKQYKEELTLSRHGHVYENDTEMDEMHGYNGMCIVDISILGQSVHNALQDLETKFFLNIDTDIKVISAIPTEYAQANSTNFTRPIHIENIGMSKSYDQEIYATDVQYYLVEKNSMKKIQMESWGLFNAITKNKDGDEVPLQFNKLELAERWDSGIASSFNFFTNCRFGNCNSSANNSGFLVVKFRDVDGRQLSQVFPFILAYDNVYLVNTYDYNVFTGMPIIRDRAGNVTVQESGSIELGTFKKDVNGGYWQAPNLQVHLNDGREYTIDDVYKSDQKKKFVSALDELGFKGAPSWNVSLQDNLYYLPTAKFSWKLDGWEKYLAKLSASVEHPGQYNIARYFEIPVVNYESGSSAEFGGSYKDSTMRETTKIVNQVPHIRVEATVTAQAADIFSRAGLSPYTRLLSAYSSELKNVYFDNHAKAGLEVGNLEYSKRSDNYSFLDDFRKNVQFPVNVELMNKNSTISVGELYCSPFDKVCKWNGEASTSHIITTSVGSIRVSYKLDQGSDGFSVLHVNYEALVSPDENKFTYIIDNITYNKMVDISEDEFDLYFPKAYADGLGIGSKHIRFIAKDEVNGSMKKDLTEDVFSVINKYRTQVCNWNGNKATLSCQIAIAPDYFEGKKNQLTDVISSNVVMTLNFVIPSPNGEWQTKVLAPQDVTYVDADSHLNSNQAVVGGKNSGFNGVFVREYNIRK